MKSSKLEKRRQMVKQSYQPLARRGTAVGKWKYMPNLSNEFVGVYSKGNKVTLAYRGTKWYNMKDLKADWVHMVNGDFRNTEKYKEARAHLHNVISTLGDNKDVTYELTGHSLGGKVAQLLKHDVLPNTKSTLFQPAAVPWNKLTWDLMSMPDTHISTSIFDPVSNGALVAAPKNSHINVNIDTKNLVNLIKNGVKAYPQILGESHTIHQDKVK